MNDGKGRRATFSALGTVVVILVYFFVFAEPLSAELSVVPRWRVHLSVGDANPVADGTGLLAFAAGDRYGYFSPDGDVAFMAESQGGTTISDTSYVSPPSGTTSAVLRNPLSEEITTLTAVSPFYASGRLFSAEGDGTAVASYDEYGRKAWSYSFPCHLGAFSAGDKLVVGGTVDGWLEGVDAEGRNVFSFAPGGSRLPVVLGVGASRSGAWVAAVTGIDKQRLVVLGRGGNDYRVASHRYLESDFREPVRVVVMEDDRHVLYRRDDGIGVWAVDGSVDEVLPVRADTFDVSLDDSRGIAYLLARRGRKSEIVAFRLPATLLGRIALPDSSEFVRFSGSSAYIGGRTWLARFDFVED
jgi:hypothetical protein